MENGIILDTNNIYNHAVSYDLLNKDFLIVKFGTIKSDGTVTILKDSKEILQSSPIPCGVLIDFHCNDINIIKNSAKVLALNLKNYNLQYPIVIDLGDIDTERYFVNSTKEEITNVIKQFIDTLNSYGYYCIVRTDTIFYKNIDVSKLNDLMLKDYHNDTPTYPCRIHEYTVIGNDNNGGVEGITWFAKGQQEGVFGDVIQLKSFIDYKKIIKDGNWNKYKEPIVIDNPVVEPSNPIEDKPTDNKPDSPISNTEISTLINDIISESDNLKTDVDNIVKDLLNETLNKIKEIRKNLKE